MLQRRHVARKNLIRGRLDGRCNAPGALPSTGSGARRRANHGSGRRDHTRSASLRRSSFLRSLGSSSFLRSRIAFGVTSTSSSSVM
jgi:hypothetical protein